MRVEHTIHDLAADLAAVPVKFASEAPKVVRKNAEAGNREAKRLARMKSGPHGKNYHKRLSAEMVTPYMWEYGPEGDPKTEFVGAGWRHGVNLDLPNSADLIGPRFADDVGALADRLFWP